MVFTVSFICQTLDEILSWERESKVQEYFKNVPLTKGKFVLHLIEKKRKLFFIANPREAIKIHPLSTHPLRTI